MQSIICYEEEKTGKYSTLKYGVCVKPWKEAMFDVSLYCLERAWRCAVPTASLAVMAILYRRLAYYVVVTCNYRIKHTIPQVVI